MKMSVPKVSIYGFCGLAAYGVDQAMNYELMIGLEGGVTSLVIAVPIAGLLCCISWPAAWRCLSKAALKTERLRPSKKLCQHACRAHSRSAGRNGDRDLVPGRSALRPKEWTDTSVGEQRHAPSDACRSTVQISLSVRRHMPGSWQRSRPHAAVGQHACHANASQRD